MPRTQKQRKAACAALGAKKRGAKPRAFASMGVTKLKHWCKGPLHK